MPFTNPPHRFIHLRPVLGTSFLALYAATFGATAGETTAEAPSPLVNVRLAYDAPAETVVFKNWHRVNVGNAPTMRTRSIITLFGLAAANMTPAQALGEGENIGDQQLGSEGVQWTSPKFAEQALKYAREGLWFFKASEITPSNLEAKAKEIVARAAKGVDNFWKLERPKPWKVQADAPPGGERIRTYTAYTLDDLKTLMQKQQEAAQAFLQALDKVRKGTEK